jgi:hypothetical protein
LRLQLIEPRDRANWIWNTGAVHQRSTRWRRDGEFDAKLQASSFDNGCLCAFCAR